MWPGTRGSCHTEAAVTSHCHCVAGAVVLLLWHLFFFHHTPPSKLVPRVPSLALLPPVAMFTKAKSPRFCIKSFLLCLPNAGGLSVAWQVREV